MIDKEEKILGKYLSSEQMYVLRQNNMLHLVVMSMRMLRDEEALVKNIEIIRCCTEVCESCKQPKEAEAEKYCHHCNSIESI
tara:strand:- start:680 stop:925 length:246 start_codon:yes stop_codon:yes gene_type:complete